MPTVLRVGRYRFFFYSSEGIRPPHIPVEAGGDKQSIGWIRSGCRTLMASRLVTDAQSSGLSTITQRN